MARHSSELSRLSAVASQATSFEDVRREVQSFLERVEGNPLRTWLRYFDTNHDQRISLKEFQRGMEQLKFAGDSKPIFNMLDTDQSGELSLNEIDNASADLWLRFRKWCVETFQSPRDFMLNIGRGRGKPLDLEAFSAGIKANGWHGGMEDALFNSIITDSDSRSIGVSDLAFLTEDWKRHRRKAVAKAKTQQKGARRLSDRAAVAATLQDFRRHLLVKFGNIIRAWRRCIDLDQSMTVSKVEISRACQDMGWQGHQRILWKALDKSESGVVTLEELDSRSAEQLAQLRSWFFEKFGGIRAAFNALDKNNQHRLKRVEFLNGISEAGFNFNKKGLFEGLDYQGNNFIVLDDLDFLESWNPPAYLAAIDNPHAAAEFKEALLKHFKHHIKGWRFMDRDCSNRVSWHEFQRGCKAVGFRGDCAGAWRHLDSNRSGFITLQDIDKNASDAIMEFKAWAEEEFGSARVAFDVLDEDQSQDVSLWEFRCRVRDYGFRGDAKPLFVALDVDSMGTLSLKELSFVDSWEAPEEFTAVAAAVTEGAKLHGQFKSRPEAGTVRFATEAPPPGAYEIPSSIGAARTTPTIHFRGSPRWPTQELSAESRSKRTTRFPPLKVQDGVGPAHYNTETGLQQASKPKYSFGRSSRFSNAPTPREGANPGPGDYATVSASTSPRHVFGARRPVVMHPLSRVELM